MHKVSRYHQDPEFRRRVKDRTNSIIDEGIEVLCNCNAYEYNQIGHSPNCAYMLNIEDAFEKALDEIDDERTR